MSLIMVHAQRLGDGSYAGQLIANGQIAWRRSHRHRFAWAAKSCARKKVR